MYSKGEIPREYAEFRWSLHSELWVTSNGATQVEALGVSTYQPRRSNFFCVSFVYSFTLNKNKDELVRNANLANAKKGDEFEFESLTLVEFKV